MWIKPEEITEPGYYAVYNPSLEEFSTCQVWVHPKGELRVWNKSAFYTAKSFFCAGALVQKLDLPMVPQ